jgi:hypothetical protein
VPLDALGADRMVAIRAALFMVLGFTLLRAPPSDLWRIATQPDGVSAWLFALCLVPCLVAAEFSTALASSSALTITIAAASEEAVYRLALPYRIFKILEVRGHTRVTACLAFLIAQVGFGLSHVAIAGGFPTAGAVLSFVRLVSAGCLLASVRVLLGVPAAVGMHALANFAVLSTTNGEYRVRGTVLAWTSVAACLHLILAVSISPRRVSLMNRPRPRPRPPNETPLSP